MIVRRRAVFPVRYPIRWKLIFAIGIPIAIAYTAILFVNYRRERRAAMERMREHLTDLTSREATIIDSELESVAQAARTIAFFCELEPNASTALLTRMLRGNLTANPRLHGSGVAFEAGEAPNQEDRFALLVSRVGDELRATDPASASLDYRQNDWYLIPLLLGAGAWTEPYYNREAGELLLSTYSAPILESGRVRGVATADISLDDLQDRLAHLSIEGGYVMIVSQDGAFIAHPQGELMMRWSIFALAEWYASDAWDSLGRRMVRGESGIERVPDARTGQPFWVVFSPIKSAGWSLAAVVPDERVMEPVYQVLREETALLGAGLVILLASVAIASFQITYPIARLSDAVERMASGELDAKAEGRFSKDEIGQFARTFNRMVDDLNAYVHALTDETARREAIEGELRAARRIQQSLLPDPLPPRTDLELAAVNAPALQVAGDYYDYFVRPDGVIVALVADVSGKGMPAALFMAVTRTVLRAVEARGGGPAEVLSRANPLLTESNPQGMFVTVLLAHYEPASGRLTFASAGHASPIVVNPAGAVRSIPHRPALMMGFVAETNYSDAETSLEPGETLVLYTDGVTDAHAPDRTLYGEDRLKELLAANADKAPAALCQAVVAALDEFENRDHHDDITVLALRRAR